MKKTLIITILFLFFIPSTLGSSGGPGPVIKKIFFNENKIYMQQSFYGGRGDTEILQIDINDHSVKPLYTWEDSIRLNHKASEYREYAKGLIPSSATPLKEVSLEKLNTLVEFSPMLEEEDIKRLEEDSFLATTFGDWRIKGDLSISGKWRRSFFISQCTHYTDPINIRGYSLPEKNFILMIATYMGNCSEYGYFSEDFFIVSDITALNNDYFLKDIHNAVIPAGYSEEEFCCPLGTKVFPSPYGIYSDILPVYKMINNVGFEEYKKKNYIKAKKYFNIAMTLAEGESSNGTSLYLTPRINFTATCSKIGDYQCSLKALEQLFIYRNKEYSKKIFNDSDFTPMRKDIFWLYIRVELDFFKNKIIDKKRDLLILIEKSFIKSYSH